MGGGGSAKGMHRQDGPEHQGQGLRVARKQQGTPGAGGLDECPFKKV